jgi:hypothetical protein
VSQLAIPLLRAEGTWRQVRGRQRQINIGLNVTAPGGRIYFEVERFYLKWCVDFARTLKG